jgi:hypothetical protein
MKSENLILFIIFFFVWIPTFIYPRSHKILRSAKFYNYSSVVAILILILSMMKYEMLLSQNEKIQILISLSPILFLILYKQFDKIILRKLNRNIYFSTKYLNDKESLGQTSLESLFQFTLVFIPLICAAIGLLIF